VESKKYLFNFSASYIGGGYKRVYEYVKYFNDIGGANFILHPNCLKLKEQFPLNTYFFIEQTIFDRIFKDGKYLHDIIKRIEDIQFYYSYSIPIYTKVAKVNWYHISNILPLVSFKYPLNLIDHLKMFLIGVRIKKYFYNADIISAESIYTLSLVNEKHKSKLFLSVNGGDDEIYNSKNLYLSNKLNLAVIIGTYKYKAIKDSYNIFIKLKNDNPYLKLIIIGNEKYLPKFLFNRTDIIIKGLLTRENVFQILSTARYYISTTLIENSYNAASEGIFFADESYISDIPPHRELLENIKFENVKFENSQRNFLFVNRKSCSTNNLKLWKSVIEDMIQKIENKIQSK
jgi:hypothetical protein